MIRLPDFSETRCVYFQVCGHLLRSEAAKEEPKVATRSTKAGRVYLRLFSGSTDNHLHLDIALATIFQRGKKPTATTKASDILQRLAAYNGQKIRLLLLSQYVVRFKDVDLNSGILLAGKRSAVQTSTNASAEIIGARIGIKNDAHIDMIEWDALGAEALVDIYGSLESEVSNDYLVEAFSLMQKAFAGYVLGEVST